jgi:hypothetical protein
VIANRLLIVVPLAVLAAGCGGTRTVTVVQTTKANRLTLYGHIVSLTRKGGRYELRFDPAWLLSGTAAERAAVEDGVLEPGQPVPNDNYTVEDGHRKLTFDVSRTARVTLVGKGVRPLSVSVAELTDILAGRNPRHRALFDPSNHLGFWIRIGDTYPNAVIELDQQYHP